MVLSDLSPFSSLDSLPSCSNFYETSLVSFSCSRLRVLFVLLSFVEVGKERKGCCQRTKFETGKEGRGKEEEEGVAREERRRPGKLGKLCASWRSVVASESARLCNGSTNVTCQYVRQFSAGYINSALSCIRHYSSTNNTKW